MKTNSRGLALRDAALAAMVGVVSGVDFGADFGVDLRSARSTNREPQFAGEFGNDMDVSGDFGYDFGADVAALAAPLNPAALAGPPPTPAATAALWAAHKQSQAHTSRREMLLQPNKGSSAKIERYSFSIFQAIELGDDSTISMSGQPDTHIRPQRVMMNAPGSGFVLINEIKVANVSVTIGGTSDAFEYSPLAVGGHLDMPTLEPANRASVLGDYTGYVPPGYVSGAAYTFVASFKGPATITA
jgi:hypothetical protein